jgi:hypothetical protein
MKSVTHLLDEYMRLTIAVRGDIICLHKFPGSLFPSPEVGNLTAISRCCDDPKCMWLSAEMCERTVGAA